ncbi:hypothetical protein ERICIV_04386 [Paenibacillus larvae subsp. larvae]|uniref:Uncharacterized protein n=2 Tax=Paenibacillus larvae TaxID=1464 RepID=A0A1V0USI9_9BACL|nr:hypothetical protein B1222_11620 [Paenibacillus larvae subsp. pulvifaciens]AVF28649.1 hypothetical protein ERICIII_04640 [Paenibacillus larvae subsp. larvae]MBH0343078.1 hypothetical protein [Paenibacillus larvae]AQZ46883.1 hypothetical protein B5S25_10055 [Paenibacillus larvae subsp. pulvifaciens]ARF68265.1 hypothetical protein B7C51_11265 [Paenibacillus larvae subsp. pulvifaciens]
MKNTKGILLVIALTLVLLISSYVQFNYIQQLAESSGLPAKFKDYTDHFHFIIFIISFLFQIIILFFLIGYEVFLLYFTVYFFYKRMHYLKVYIQPVLLSNLITLILNLGINLLISPYIYDIQTLKQYALFSPVNYLIKPFMLCYFLSKKNIFPNTVLDWIKVGMVYVLFTYIPSILLLLIF